MDHRGDSRYPVGGFAGAKHSMDAARKERGGDSQSEPKKANGFRVIANPSGWAAFGYRRKGSSASGVFSPWRSHYPRVNSPQKLQ